MATLCYVDNQFAESTRELSEWFTKKILERLKEIEERQNEDSEVSFKPNPNGGGKITNSYTITKWEDIYDYCFDLKQQYPEQFTGSVDGMAIEWIVHNVACYVPFFRLDQAKDVDLGYTIFDDPHPGFNALMWGLYNALYSDRFNSDLTSHMT